MTRNISEGRKAVYYIGSALALIGLILFLSMFVTFFIHFGDFSDFEGTAKSGMARAGIGMGLIILGGFISRIGTRGLAGSGVVLDPEKAREDVEPWSRMAGGMLKDALDESGISMGKSQPERIVMVKCPACGKLNEEDSKFCQECGGKL